MADALIQELTQLQQTKEKVESATKSCLHVAKEHGGNLAATTLAKVLLDTCTSTTATTAVDEGKISALLGVLNALLRDTTDVGEEIKEQLLQRNYVATCFTEVAKVAPRAKKEASKLCKGWKSDGALPVEECKKLTDILKGGGSKQQQRDDDEDGDENKQQQTILGSGTKIQTKGDVQETTGVLTVLLQQLRHLPAARRDHFMGRMEGYKAMRGATNRFKRDEETIAFLADLKGEVEGEVSRTLATSGVVKPDPTSPELSGAKGPANFEQFLLSKGKGGDQGGTADLVLPPGAGGNGGGSVPQYTTTRTLATSLLECDKAKCMSIGELSPKEVPPTGSDLRSGRRDRHPFTAKERSIFVARGAAGSVYRMRWGPSASDWVSGRADDHVGAVEQTSAMLASTTTKTEDEMHQMVNLERSKRNRD